MDNVYYLNDAMIHQGELELLDGEGWINDAIIHYHSEILLADPKMKKGVCCLLSPSIVLLLSAYCDASLGPPDLLTAEAVFIPVNDSVDLESPGGSHWSLIIFYKPTQIFYYYDSLESKRQETRAREIAASFSKIMGLKDVTVVKIQTPHQINSHDCGVYVMKISSILFDRIQESRGEVEKVGSLAKWNVWFVTPEDIKKYRTKVKEAIIS
jgi:sentrin-specific protease 8